MHRRTRRLGVLAAGIALTLTFPTAGAVAAGARPGNGPDPVPRGIDTFPVALIASLSRPDASPPGANDWGCRPTAAHPRPVVLLHGTFTNAFNSWNELSPKLKRAGFCVFALNFGAPRGSVFKATAAIPRSAKEVAAYVDKVRAATGARQVDVVGWSQGGGVLPRWYLKYEGGADRAAPWKNKVHRLIGIAPSNHGSTASGLMTLAEQLGLLGAVGATLGQAVPDQAIGSAVNRRLDRGGDTMPGIAYTTVVSRYDEIATPYQNQYLKPGPGATVRNITLQDECPEDHTEHLGIPYDPVALDHVHRALDPAHAPTPRCTYVPPIVS
ncbi:esterase/lipase family protein [Streptomyces sp. NPDC054796]